MGLDMYLYKRNKTKCPHCGKEIVDSRDSEEICYWRKANAIHKWFEDHCSNGYLENCEECIVTKDKLIELRNTCEKVLDSSKVVNKTVKERYYDFETGDYKVKDIKANVLDDISVAEKLLPTEEGFFFGGVLYDESYVEKLKYTIKKINEILEIIDFDNSVITYYGWW